MPTFPNNPPPKSEKKNQHFVPRNWLSRFAGLNGSVYCLRDETIRVVSVANIMSGDWIYTLFDEWWRPSDVLEDKLGNIEGCADKLFSSLHSVSRAPTDSEWCDLILFLALTACRHPDTMAQGHRRAKEMAWALADISSCTDESAFLSDFKTRFATDMPAGLFEKLCNSNQEVLLEEGQEIELLQPHDFRLPEQISLESVQPVANCMAVMDLSLLDAPDGCSFVLGDRPLPLRDLARGFDVPLSKNLAFQAKPTLAASPRSLQRRLASPEEVGEINQHQKNRAKDLLIGPSYSVLRAFLA